MSLDEFLEKFEEALDQCDKNEDIYVSIQVHPGQNVGITLGHNLK